MNRRRYQLSDFERIPGVEGELGEGSFGEVLKYRTLTDLIADEYVAIK